MAIILNTFIVAGILSTTALCKNLYIFEMAQNKALQASAVKNFIEIYHFD